jgi:hypothetical protein
MPKLTNNFIRFQDPSRLLGFYDEDITSGKVKLYPWQVEVAARFAMEPPEGEQNEIDAVAANDSGKSKMLVAPAALWSVCQFDKAETVLTSASGSQLDRQTGRYIKDYARRMNNFHGEDLWTIQHRLLKFHPTDGTMDLFATDEAGKAEGWHKRDFDSAFSIIVDEAKSVNDEIFHAFDRCHDAQRVLRVSSPAIGTNGYFYKVVTSNRSWVRKITAYECPHISEKQINKIIQTYGLNSPLTRSMIFAEFSSVDQSVVIQLEWLQKLQRNKPLLNNKGWPIRVGCDMAAGGDENVITAFQGNKQLDLRAWRETNTLVTKDLIRTFLTSWGVPKDSEYMFFDDGHVGHAIIDMLQNEGWNIKRVINQSAPRNDIMYANRGAELWFNFSTFIHPNEEVILLDDPVLLDQLANRYYVQASKSKIKLESKKEAKANGHPSPDRADATVLAFTDIQAPLFSLSTEYIPEKSNNIRSASSMTQEEILNMMEAFKFREFEQLNNPTKLPKGKELNCSMRELININSGAEDSREARLEELNEQLKRWKNR